MPVCMCASVHVCAHATVLPTHGGWSLAFILQLTISEDVTPRPLHLAPHTDQSVAFVLYQSDPHTGDTNSAQIFGSKRRTLGHSVHNLTAA